MGYYTHFSGSISIVPPIDDAKMKPFDTDHDSYFRIEQKPGDQTVQMVNGQITVVGNNPGETIVHFGYDDSIKGYDFQDHVARLLAFVAAEGSVANGQFYADGEETDDNWRIVVENNAYGEERGEILFPSDVRSHKADAWWAAHQTMCSMDPCPTHKNPYE